MKSLDEWLGDLTATQKKKAIANVKKNDNASLKGDYFSSLSSALKGAFVWDETTEGREYWQKIYKANK